MPSKIDDPCPRFAAHTNSDRIATAWRGPSLRKRENAKLTKIALNPGENALFSVAAISEVSAVSRC
jgi:hypothetical protein